MRLPPPYKTLHHLIQKGSPTVFVVGANRGGYVDLYRNIWQTPDFHLFEARAEAVGLMKQKHGKDSRVHINELVVTNETGVTDFHINKAAATSGILVWDRGSRDYREGHFDTLTTRRLGSIALDDYAEQHNVEHIDFLKMDIQGGELLALYGASGLLSRQAIDVIQAEIMFSDMYKDSPTFCGLDEYLRQFNYNFYTFVVPATTTEGRLKWIHGIWCKENYPPAS